jgi:hypothetical protein
MAVLSTGAANYLTRSVSTLDFTSDWTMALWVYIPTFTGLSVLSGYYTLFGCLHQASGWSGDVLGSFMYLSQNTDPVPNQYVIDLEVFDVSAATERVIQAAITTTGWHHVAVTYTSATNTFTLYVDGVSAGTAVYNMAIIQTLDVQQVLADSNGATLGAGGAFVGFWDSVLTAPLVALQDSVSLPLTPAAAFNQLVSADQLEDLTGNGLDFTAVGSVTTLADPAAVAAITRFDFDMLLLEQIQVSLIEPPDGGQTIPSGLWSPAELAGYLNQRQVEFLKQTQLQFGIAKIAVTAGQDTYDLPDDWITTIRALWTDDDGQIELPRSDTWEADYGIPTWSYVNARPKIFYDGGKPITIRLMPVPVTDGTLEVHYVPYSALITGVGDAMTLPDEFSCFIKWGALADALLKIGRAQNQEQAMAAAARYRLGVDVARLLLKGF